MIIDRVSIIAFLIIVLIFICPSVSAIGDYTIDLYESNREVIFSENQESQTIYMNGAVNYTGYSVSGDTISLSSSSNIGESNISPTEVTFHTTGSEEFTVELIIPNIYENGTTGGLGVTGLYQQGGTSVSKGVGATILILNYSDIGNSNNNLNDSENHEANGAPSGIGNMLMISTIIIIAIVIVIIYKKNIIKL